MSQGNVSFLSLPEKERAEGLISGINNYEGKALTLYSMKTGRQYSATELALQVINFLGEDLPFNFSRPYGYCRQSLKPIGVVVQDSRREEGWKRLITTYAKTADGETYGDPAVIRFMKLSDEFDVPLTKLNGQTPTAGSQRCGYAVAKILECLYDGKTSRRVDISDATGISENSVGGRLRDLSRLKLVEYESVKPNQTVGWSRFHIENLDRAESYLLDIEKLREDLSEKNKSFSHLQDTKKVLEFVIKKKGDTEVTEISRDAGMGYEAVVKGILGLNILGLLEYSKFKSGEIMSSAKILQRGSKAYELAYRPVLMVATEPNSSYVTQEYRELMDKMSDTEILNLFRSGIARYLGVKQSRSMHESEQKKRIVLSAAANAAARNEGSTFRVENVADELNNIGAGLNKETIRSIIYKLLKSGQIKKLEYGIYQLHES